MSRRRCPASSAGASLVFVLALGYYVTPALVGGPGDQMIGYFIAYFTNTAVNWGMASALGTILLARGRADLRRARRASSGWTGSRCADMALPPHATLLERLCHVGIRALTALVMGYLVLPILVILPLSFTSGELLVYPLPAWSLRWYREFTTDPLWTQATWNSLVLGGGDHGGGDAGSALLAAFGLQGLRSRLKPVLFGLLALPAHHPAGHGRGGARSTTTRGSGWWAPSAGWSSRTPCWRCPSSSSPSPPPCRASTQTCRAPPPASAPRRSRPSGRSRCR